MANAFNTKAIIEQMEARYKDLTVKLEGFTAIQEEMNTLSRAIRVMRGEKLTPGRVSGEHAKDKKDWAGKIIDAANKDPFDIPVQRKLPHNTNGTKDATYAILKANPRGITVRQIGEALAKQGIIVTNHTVHNALRPLKNQIREAGFYTTSRGQQAKLYALKEKAAHA